MQHKRLYEDEFATYAKETFFKGEAREIEPPKDRYWRAERMLQLVCPPCDDALWSAPPVLLPETRHDDYKWDLRPDCAYWLSLRGFNPEYSFCVSDSCFVYQEWITCPYLTIEFKRDDWKPDVATMQAAATSAMALYNRHHLRIRAVEGDTDEKRETISREHDMSTVKHYGITFTGPTYTTWLIRPATPSSDGPPMQWSSCKMSRLGYGNCTDAAGVGRLADWINEIHRWGLSTHAKSCQRDVKTLLNASGVETSVVE